eukprot:scaffold50158_cov21-Tisochrysis_lutea.AAC.3
MASEMQLSGRVCGEPGGPRFPCSGWATFAFLVFSACSHSGMLSTALVMIVLKREFATPDEEMKKIVLKVVKQCVSTEGVESDYIKTEILPEFFKAFWVRRMALDSCGPPGTSCLQGLPGVAHLTGQASSACVAGMPSPEIGAMWGAIAGKCYKQSFGIPFPMCGCLGFHIRKLLLLLSEDSVE